MKNQIKIFLPSNSDSVGFIPIARIAQPNSCVLKQSKTHTEIKTVTSNAIICYPEEDFVADMWHVLNT